MKRELPTKRGFTLSVLLQKNNVRFSQPPKKNLHSAPHRQSGCSSRADVSIIAGPAPYSEKHPLARCHWLTGITVLDTGM